MILELDTVNVCMAGAAPTTADLVLYFSVDILKVEDVCHRKSHFWRAMLTRSRRLSWNSLAESGAPGNIIDDANPREAPGMYYSLRVFHPLLESGDYYVIEDGIISDLYPDVYPDFKRNPHTAVRHL